MVPPGGRRGRGSQDATVVLPAHRALPCAWKATFRRAVNRGSGLPTRGPVDLEWLRDPEVPGECSVQPSRGIIHMESYGHTGHFHTRITYP